MFVIGENNSVYLIQWSGLTGATPTVLKTLFTVEEGTDHRFNHAIAGPNGDLYAGTLAPTYCGRFLLILFNAYIQQTICMFIEWNCSYQKEYSVVQVFKLLLCLYH